MPRLLSSIIIDLLVLVADSFCLPPGHHEMSGFFTMDRNVTKPPTLMALHHLRFGSWPRPAHLSPWTRQTHGHTCTKGAVRPPIAYGVAPGGHQHARSQSAILEEPKNLFLPPIMVRIVYNF